MLKIALVKRLGPPYEKINTKYRNYTKHLKTKYIGPEECIFNYLKSKSKYKNKYDFRIITSKSFKNTQKMKSFDKTLFLFEEFVNPFMNLVIKNKRRNLYNNHLKTIKSLNNIYPSYKFIEFVTNKCKYYKFFQSHGIPVAPTYCINLKNKVSLNKRFDNVKKLKWKRIFFKPQPGGNSTNAFDIKNKTFKKSHLNYHLEKFENKQYNQMVLQKYMKNLATKKYPEIRTFWIGDKYQYSINTCRTGCDWHIKKDKIPPEIIQISKKVMYLLKQKFKIPLLISRIDFGYNSYTKSFFVNEFEYAPNTFASLFPHDKWTLDKKLGDYIIHLLNNNLI